MNLRPDCVGCVADSNVPTAHEPHCNYRHWPGLYDTIEQQKSEIAWLRTDQSSRESDRAERHHDVLCIVLKVYLDQYGVDDKLSAERVAMARTYADLAYPPPKAEP